MLQKSIITTRAFMISLTVLSIGMIFIASSSVFAASGDKVHLSIVRALSSDRGCVRVLNGNNPQIILRDVSLPQKNIAYDAGTYDVGMQLDLEIHNGGRCEDPALSTASLYLGSGDYRPDQSGPFTYESVFTVDQ